MTAKNASPFSETGVFSFFVAASTALNHRKNYSLNSLTSAETVAFASPKITFDANGGAASDGSTEAYQYLAGIYTAFTGEWKFSVLSSKNSSGEPGGVPTDYWAATLNKNTFTRDGYEFLGWDESSTAKTPRYTDEQYLEKAFYVGQLSWENKYGTKELISDRVLYAVWKQK